MRLAAGVKSRPRLLQAYRVGAVRRRARLRRSQCLARAAPTEDEALDNLKEAPALHFDPPQATHPPKVRVIEVEVGAA